MMTVYLVRHGQSEGNRYRQFDGQYNAPLTGLGRKQVAAVGRRFADIHLDAVFSSDQQRAYQTALAIATPKGLTVRSMVQFRELHNGIWEHLMWADIDRDWPGQEDLFGHHMDRWSMAGAESPMEGGLRYINGIKKLAERYDGQTIAIVGHGDAMRVTLGLMQGIPLDKIGQDKQYSTNTAVTKVEYENGQFRICYIYDYSHLPDELINVATPYSSLGLSYRFLPPQADFPIEGLPAPVDRTVGTWIGGYIKGTPVSLMQLLPTRRDDPGEIGYYFIAPSFRGYHLGIQPVGQAVDLLRKCGVSSLRMRLVTDEMRAYFPKFDFIHVEGDIWELPILPIPALDMYAR